MAGFLHRVFIAPNERVLAQSDLAEALEDELFALRERLAPDAYPRSALDYLDDWANPQKGWLREFYRSDTDKPHFDFTPATEKAIAWVISLSERSFVGTESRLLTLFGLPRQMCEGAETDPEARFKELLNENTIREAANFHSRLSRERESIKDKIARINRSLSQIDYSRGRHLRLERERIGYGWVQDALSRL